ncbi:hypothetical protein [Tropicibacter naphthalenivorans]|uniref:Uncharacterized protein n=1 Tax=Tropicibacter naphthalenivorans TaxID=441103 RepID=A0A0P1G0I5_9RHOB|nr:hypothetical protein [Tropicibacter naphthalenivorans]CUH74996.1 hypothetical protein TRN7648_00190 [Tropicibacter naphthalenivorans]SMC47555.1 hypothetical protein SAMN04488093_101689 [Tropicibacter naphthalenivorans]
MTERFRIEHRDKRFHVLTRTAVDAAWFSLGGASDVRVAVRLWLSLIGGRANE